MRLARDADGKPLFSSDGRGVRVERDDLPPCYVDATSLPVDLSARERGEVAGALLASGLVGALPSPVPQAGPILPPAPAPKVPKHPVVDPQALAALAEAGAVPAAGRKEGMRGRKRSEAPSGPTTHLLPPEAVPAISRVPVTNPATSGRMAEAKIKQEEAKAARLASQARQEEARANEAEKRAAEAEAKQRWAEERTRQERQRTRQQASSTRQAPLEVLPARSEAPAPATEAPANLAEARLSAQLAQAHRDREAAALEALQLRIMAETLRDEEGVARRQAREHLAGGSPWKLAGWGLLGAMAGQVPGAVLFAQGCYQGDAVAGLLHTLFMVGGAVWPYPWPRGRRGAPAKR